MPGAGSDSAKGSSIAGLSCIAEGDGGAGAAAGGAAYAASVTEQLARRLAAERCAVASERSDHEAVMK